MRAIPFLNEQGIPYWNAYWRRQAQAGFFDDHWAQVDAAENRMDFDDGLSAVISAVMRSGTVDYPTARTIVHALHNAGYLV
jgi:hypothetical protein